MQIAKIGYFVSPITSSIVKIQNLAGISVVETVELQSGYINLIALEKFHDNRAKRIIQRQK